MRQYGMYAPTPTPSRPRPHGTSPVDPVGPVGHDWYESQLGAFVLAHERRLVQKTLSQWPHRGRSLLEVACGTGRFLDIFWEAGYDVTGLDHDPSLLEAARQRLGGRVDTRLGAPDELPFEDASVDFVSVSFFALCGTNAPDVLREAARVAALGVLLRFWNPRSMAGMGNALRAGLPPDCLDVSWRNACKAMRLLTPHCLLSTHSVLHAPMSTWRTSVFDSVNNAILPLPTGALLALRMTHAPSTPLTAHPLRINPLRPYAHADAAQSSAVGRAAIRGKV